ncbi:MAG: cupin domain-containing protein [Phycisphaerae bacterium]
MNTVNAIAKARFASARPQRVQLQSDSGLSIELLCLEPGQNVSAREGQWVYYVITGKATVQVGQEVHELGTGHLALSGKGERHSLSNAAETRLICLAVERTD